MKIYCGIVLVVGLAFFAVAGETNTPANPIFGQYDHALIKKVQDHWYAILDAKPLKNPRSTGKVDIKFCLFPDGHVSDLKVNSTTIEESEVVSCTKAIMDSSPFGSWTKEIRQAYTNDTRDMHFTFYLD